MDSITPLRRSYLLALGGFLAGLVNGLLGAGGGIIIVWILGKVSGKALDGKDIFANALSIMLPVSAVSAISYALRGALPATGVGVYIIPAILGGLVGAFLLDRLHVGLVKSLFALIVIWSGISMMVGGN